MRLRAAARGSKLSRRQVEIFVDYAKSLLPGLEVELVGVRTRGDIVRDRPISSVGGKGVFSKEVNMPEEARVLVADYLGEIHFRLVEGSDDDIQLTAFIAWLSMLGRKLGVT